MDLHQSENKHLPENKEVLYIVLDNYDETDARSATGLEIKRQILLCTQLPQAISKRQMAKRLS